jgi:hypothetical protein
MNIKLIEALDKNQRFFHPVVEVSPSIKIAKIDLSSGNDKLSEEIVNDIFLFEAFINSCLKEATADFLIGGYLEYRALYGRSEVFDGKDENSIRRLHIGLDIWGPVGTPVYAPMEGVIHSIADNNKKGDYGVTIILKHEIDGVEFHSLYGHLSKRDLHHKKGNKINKGDLLAHYGSHQENGYWPPHLHFQLIEDMQGMEGDYPGVCSLSDKTFYQVNCPDPNILLKLLPNT